MKSCIERKQNWLPLPPFVRLHPSNPLTEVDQNDLFPKAIVLSYFPLSGVGTLLTDRGDELGFSAKHLSLAGAKGLSDLSVGMKVGYDVNRVGRERKVKTIKVY